MENNLPIVRSTKSRDLGRYIGQQSANKMTIVIDQILMKYPDTPLMTKNIM